MSLATLMNRACTITHRTWATTVNARGNKVPTETDVSTVCELQPGGSQSNRGETSDPGQLATSSWMLILPAATTIGVGDTVTIDSDEYEVIGEPWVARNPRTQADSHIEATVRRVTGAQA